MRIARDTIRSTFHSIAREKEEKYLARFPKPTPPTDKEIVEAIRKGNYSLSSKCGCDVRSTTYSGYVDRFPLSEILRVAPIVAYHKKAAAHRKRLEAYKAKIDLRKKEDITYCMYGPGQTEKGAFYAKAEEFKAWTP
jgi:hypothetical protein